MAKKALSPEQKLMKAIYGKPIEEMNDEEKREAYEKAKRLQDRFQFPNKSISFNIPANEKTMASEAATSMATVRRRRDRCSATRANDSAAAARSISARRGGNEETPSSRRPFTKSSISRYSFISIPPTSLSILVSQCAST